MPNSIKRAWPADRVSRWPVTKLLPYAKNSRKHTAGDIVVIAKSITRWGFTVPVLVAPDGTIIAGHARVLAARKLGLAEVPVMIADGWSEEERRAYVLADNQIAARATWDEDLLKSEVANLVDFEFDLELLGFDSTAMADLLKPSGKLLGDPDEIPECPVRPTSRLGDAWLLGSHRVVCGDATNAEHVALAMGGNKPNLMVSDPPYGISYDPAWRNKALGPADRAAGKVLNDDRADWREAWALFPGDVAYIWHASLLGGGAAESLEFCGFDLRSQIIWAKDHFAIGRSEYHWQHEACIYAVRKGAKSRWASDRKQSTIWNFPSNNGSNGEREATWGHGTQKPTEAMRRPIEHNSQPGDIVFDPFLGSGTTLIAAELMGRVCIGLELNPAYVDVIVKRWTEYTGGSATLASSGQSFEVVAAERCGVEHVA